MTERMRQAIEQIRQEEGREGRAKLMSAWLHLTQGEATGHEAELVVLKAAYQRIENELLGGVQQ